VTPNSARLSPVLAYDPDRHLFVGRDQSLGWGWLCTPRPGGSEREEQQLRVILEDEWPPGSHLQFLLYASPNLVRPIDAIRTLRRQSGSALDAALAARQCDWLAARADAPFEEVEGLHLRDFRLVVTGKIPIGEAVPSEDDLNRALQASHRMERSLTALDLLPEPMTARGFVTACSELLNRGPHASWRRFGHVPVAPDKYLNEQLLDLGTSLRVDSRGIDLEGGGRLVLCSPKSFAEAAFFGMAQYLVSDVFLGRRGLFAPFFLSLTVFYPEQQALRSRLAMKRAWTVNSAHSPLVKWLPGLETRHRDFNVLTESMDNGHRPVRFALTLGVYGRDASAAEAAVTDAVNFWAEQSCVLLPDRFVAAPLLINALPLGADRRAITELGRYHTMTTEQTACFAPVFGPWRGTGTPVVTPVSRDGQLMSFDLYDSQTNANAVIAAESGAGKSFLAQLMTASYLAAGATVWTIDIGGSYRNLCERLGGEYIDFADREISLNPFRLVTDWEEESDIVEALIGSMAAATEKLTDLQRSVLGRTLRDVWAALGPETSIDAIVDRLKNEPDQRIQDLGDQLYPFTAAGPYGRFFRGENTVSFRNRYTVLELGALRNRAHLQRIVLLQLIFQIQAAMHALPRDAKKLLFVDEAWELLTDGEVGKFIEHGYRRFRKHRGSMTLATQSLADLYNTQVGVAIAENSATKILLGQKPEVIDRLIETSKLTLPPGLVKLLKSVHSVKNRYSEAFFITDSGAGVGRIIVDPATRLLFSSDGADVAALDAARAHGDSLEDAIAAVLAARARGRRPLVAAE
jgi:conjugal transfer ATP-binding protein TraC